MILIAKADVPIWCAPTLNQYARLHWNKRRSRKLDCYVALQASGLSRQKVPIQGKPLVKMTRYSAAMPDKDSAWTKIPLDCLKQDPCGFGYIRDDSPRDIQLVTKWERAPGRQGRVFIEIWADGPA